MGLLKLAAVAALGAALAACGGTDPAGDVTPASKMASRLASAAGAQAGAGEIRIAGYRDNYSIARDGVTGLVVVTDKITGAILRYQDPGLIKFADKFTSFDVDGTAGQVYRLYQAAFNRTPDPTGLGFWINVVESGARTMEGVAADFGQSAEFKGLYGDNPGNGQLVTLSYNNVLHRAPERGGFDFWMTALANGLSPQGLLSSFSESAENKGSLNPGLKAGFDYLPSNQGGPLLPKRSSYENKAAAMAVLGPVALPAFTNGEIIGAGYAFADFFQDGSYSMVVNSGDFSARSAPDGPPTLPGTIHFFSRVDGTWVENTSKLLADTTGCISARKLIVADFNGDGKPDVFLACHGLDAPPFPGEPPRFLMSQADGSYKNQVADFNCFCHGAAAADVNGNGYADLVVVDTVQALTPYYLVNNRNGSFTRDFKRMPQSVAAFSYPGQTARFAKQIYSIELLDLQQRGIYDLFIGANEPNSASPPVTAASPNYFPSSLYLNDGSDHFSDAGRVLLPNPDPNYGLPLDIVFDQGKLYLLRVIDNDANPAGFYGGVAVQQVDYPSLASTIIYRHVGSYDPASDGQNWKWFPWFGIYAGKIHSTDAAYDVAIGL